LHILMVTARYFPEMGGVQTHVHEVGRRLVSNGMRVTLLTTMPHKAATEIPSEEDVEGMHIVRVRAWPPQRDYYIAPEIRTQIKQGKWDIIHCQGCHNFVPPLAMLTAREVGIPYIVSFHTGGHSEGWRKRIRGIQWRAQRSLFAHAAKLIGVSRFEAEYFRQILKLPPHLFTIIPNGGVLPDSAGAAGTLAPATPDADLILSVGRLERYKGHQHLITALPSIRKKRPQAHLLILGAGPYESTLRELAWNLGLEKYIELRAVPAGDSLGMAQILSQAALVALLSEYEAHPIAVMEALSLQRPVLVADTSGLREIAEQGLARAVSLNSTPEEIAQAVLQQLECPLLPSTQLSLPTWDECVSQLQAVYRMAVGEEVCVS
jgi:glycosyltransferase involved in cell wall biosynthesis